MKCFNQHSHEFCPKVAAVRFEASICYFNKTDNNNKNNLFLMFLRLSNVSNTDSHISVLYRRTFYYCLLIKDTEFPLLVIELTD